MSGFGAEAFLDEAQDLLQALEEHLLELENGPDEEQVNAAFRALHTLKGSGEMFGFSALAAFVHHFESAFDEVRTGRRPVTRDLVAVALDSRDHIATLLSAGPGVTPAPDVAAAGDSLLARLVAPQPASDGAAASADTQDRPPSARAAATAPRSVTIRFRPEPGALRNGFRPDLLISELSELGTLSVTCSAEDVPPIETLDAAACYLVWSMVLETAASRDEIEDVFIFVSEGDLEIDDPRDTVPVEEEEAAPGDAAAPADAPAAPPAATATAEEAAPASDPAAAAADTSPAAKPAAPPAAAPAEAGAGGEAAGQAQGGASVRVQAHRLDDLMDQLGELVIAQARLRRVAGDLGDISLDTAAEEIERLVTSLRDTTLSIRMLPISLAFGRFRRLLRDLSRDLGKDVALRTLGGETEVDKNVFDSLGEPLIHMVRNAVDHGIEPAADRIAAGKTAQATVTLAARQAGGEVLISVSDDGRGLDPAAIRARAVERGMIDAEAALDESEIHQLIFAPGFSTAVTVTSVSGRGVGMDAVRRMVDELRGTIEVRSELGQGTEVTLRLPLTLAIIEGLLVRVAGSCCVLPLSSVEECVELPASEDERGAGRALLRIRDELVPYLELDEVFGFGREATANRRRVVIVRVEGRRTGLVIDEVLGQHQTVIKPLSPYHRKIEGLAGCTILGDGAVALILDPAAIVKAAQQARRLVA